MDAEEKTAHEVRRLKSSVQDLQNALRLASKMEFPVRPSRDALSALTEPSANPYSHILANNERGVLRGIERLQDIGVAVVGLNGMGALTAEAFTRYGVKSLVLIDNAEIALSDLSYMQFQAQDVGKRKDERLAAALRKLNPDVRVIAAGVAVGRVQDTIRVLRSAAAAGNSKRVTTQISSSNDDWNSDDSSESSEISSESSDDESSSDSETRGSEPETHKDAALSQVPGAKPRALDSQANRLLHVVFLCVENRELASALNELCCELGALFVFVFVGGNGISGEVLSVAPGRSSCLQCFEKRKIYKAVPATPASTVSAAESQADAEDSQQQQQHTRSQQPRLRPCLPSTECILSGLGVQNAIMQLLGFGSFCSRVEYDGLLDEMDRSGFLAPVHQCPGAFCRLQQQAHSSK